MSYCSQINNRVTCLGAGYKKEEAGKALPEARDREAVRPRTSEGASRCLKRFVLGLSRSLMSELEKVQSVLPKLANVLSHLIPTVT